MSVYVTPDAPADALLAPTPQLTCGTCGSSVSRLHHRSPGKSSCGSLDVSAECELRFVCWPLLLSCDECNLSVVQLVRRRWESKSKGPEFESLCVQSQQLSITKVGNVA